MGAWGGRGLPGAETAIIPGSSPDREIGARGRERGGYAHIKGERRCCPGERPR